MKEKLVLQEDDMIRDKSHKQSFPEVIRAIRMIFIATPVLVSCMYLLMRNIPKENFPKDFWTLALFLPISCLLWMIGASFLTTRFTHHKVILSAAGVRSGSGNGHLIPWRRVSEWRVEDSREYPGYFSIEFRGSNRLSAHKIILSNAYSKEEIRNYIMHSIAKAY